MQIHRHLERLPTFRRAVLTIGSFDGLHRGHLTLIERVKTLAGLEKGESVVVTFAPHPRKVLRPDLPPPRLLNSLEEKIERFQATGIDHLVIVPFTPAFSESTARGYVEDFLYRYFQPARIVIGYDHKFGANRVGNVELLRELAPEFGYEVEEVGAAEVDELAVSSTRIRNAIEAGHVAEANDLLGYAYPISGTVVSGQRIGRRIGFPTANVAVSEADKLLPAEGIYAATAYLNEDATAYPGMLYLGRRPSLEDDDALSIEMHLFDFDRNIYDQPIRLELHAFIRGDRRLDSLEALSSQLASDREAVQNVFKSKENSGGLFFLTNEVASLVVDDVPTPSVAIVILNYNGRNYLEKFLPPLLASLRSGCRVIVADNKSTDDSLPWLRANYPELERIELVKNHGFAGGYNEALAQVEADIFVLLNSDVEVTPDWLEPCLQLFATDPTVGACQPKILAHQQPDRFEYAGAAGGWVDSLGYPFCRGRVFTVTEVDHGQYDEVREIFWASGAALFVRAELFKKLGGFEAEYFAHAEEIDLCWRMKRAGYRVMAQPAAQVYHVGGGTLAYRTPRKTYLNFRNTLVTSFKNEPGAKLFWWLPLRLVLDGLAGLLFLFQGDFQHIAAILRAHFHVYPRLGFWYRRRLLRKQQITVCRIGPSRVAIGTLHDSVIVHYYLLGHTKFSQILRKQYTGLAPRAAAAEDEQ